VSPYNFKSTITAVRILLFILLTIQLHSQTFYEHQFTPFDGKKNDYFGRSVAISDSFIFIGSPFDDNYSGSVYVYKNINNNWEFWKKIFASDRSEFFRFGTEILLKEDKLFIGAISTRVNNITSGAVYFFKYENDDWIEKQKIVPPELQYEGGFSNSITFNNNILAIGALRYKYIFEYVGKVFLFVQENDNYSFLQEIVPSYPDSNRLFGGSVILDSNILLVGSVLGNTSSGYMSGSVYLFVKEDSLWVEKKKYIPDTNSDFLGYGGSMAMNDQFVFIGAYGEIGYIGPGSVYIYEKTSDSLKFIQKIFSGEEYDYDSFGYPIKVRGDTLLIGSPSDTTFDEITGTAYLFTNKDGFWEKQKKFNPSDYENANEYGISLDFNNRSFLIGAPSAIVDRDLIGKAYLYNDIPVNINETFCSEGPTEFILFQNYPNPFNPTTSIEYRVGSTEYVTLKVYDLLGREVAVLVNEEKPAGEYKVEFSAEGGSISGGDAYNLASGIYYYQLSAGKFIETKKAILIK
jgi:hypothetical protein